MTKVLTEQKGFVTVIRMNLPERMNCLQKDLQNDLKDALRQFKGNAESRVAILTGSGRAFCAGGDLEELGSALSTVEFYQIMKASEEIIELITDTPKPVIAAVNGAAAGAGFSIALACDLIVASTNALFMQAFAKVGLIPDLGSFYFLPRVVGMHKAKELIWTARPVRAEEALQMGIINKLVSPEKLEDEAMSLADKLAAGPPFAIGLAKTLLARSLTSNLRDMLQYEGMGQAICLSSDDNKEGIRAFYEKKDPVFRGK